LTSVMLDGRWLAQPVASERRWAAAASVFLRFITSGKPVESCNGKLRDECLRERRFVSLSDDQRMITSSLDSGTR